MRAFPKVVSLGLAVLISVALILPASGQEQDVADTSLDQAVEESVEAADGSVGEGPPPTAPVATPNAALSERDIAAKVGPSIVQIRVGDFGGSGVKVAQGVLTAAHLVSRGANPEIINGGGQRARATVARCDMVKDVALLQTDITLPALPLTPARSHAQGDPILTFGYPSANVLGGQPTLTRGIISAIRTDEDGTLLVQTDASFNPGSSGGALVDLQGNLLAVAAFSLRETQGLNFGVASESIQTFLDGPARSCPSPTPMPPATPIPGVGGVVLSDNFDDEARGVLPRSSTDPSKWRRGYVGGEYQLQKLDAASSTVPYASVPGTYGNASIAVDVRLVGDARSVALTCREDESESAYIFAVSPGAGTFALLRMDNGTQVDLVTQRTGSFRPGGAANRIELTCAGDSISGSVNGTQVASIRDTMHPREGSMTLILLGRGAGEARFDNLVVTRR